MSNQPHLRLSTDPAARPRTPGDPRGGDRTSTARSKPRPKPRRSLVPILLPIVGISLLMLVLMNSWLRPAKSARESEVIREIRTLVLAKSQTKGLNDGGEIGSWWVSAEGSDAVTGTLKAFRVDAGPTIIAAKEADLYVDPDLNAFSFELRDVVIIRLGIEGQAAPDPSVLKLDTYRLGPIPYYREIEPDSGPPALRRAPSEPAVEPSPLTRAQ